MSVAAPLALREGDRPRLAALIRSTSTRAGLATRARIVLLASEGLPNAEIARRTGTSRPTVVDWRARYDAGGIRALHDLPRSGRPAEIDEIEVVVATLAAEGRPPEHLGVTHWSARLLADQLKISFTTVARIWRKWNLQPGRVEQACLPRHRHQEFLRFLRQVAKAYPRVKLHLVCDNSDVPATHKHPAVKAWLARNPRITLHFTPTSGSWLNMVEIFFGIITRQAIRRGTFGSVHELIDAITAFIDGWNERCRPFAWTKDADTIIAKSHRKPTSSTQH